MHPDLHAPPHWQEVDFLSDVHLHPEDPITLATWAHYLRTTPADAVFILGDLFDVWIGDDAASVNGSFEQHCLQVLQTAAQCRPVFFMHGNRDFLFGQTAAQSAHITLLPDPTVLEFAGTRWMLAHGDALCLDDLPYQAFRKTVRSAAWQDQFLAQPLALRREQARALRAQSEQRKHSTQEYIDLDTVATRQHMQALRADHTIHGHTHQPADHALEGGQYRIVLSDWDSVAHPARAEVLRLLRNPVLPPTQSVRWQRIAVHVPSHNVA